jgi:hypothetical protein
MCKVHWNKYTTALRQAALARKAADGGEATEVAPTKSDRPRPRGRGRAPATARSWPRSRSPSGRTRRGDARRKTT